MGVTANVTVKSNFSSFERELNITTSKDSAFNENADNVIRWALIVILFITMVSLGCTMEISKIRSYLIRPKGVAIAVGAQYGIMPLTGFCFAKLFQLNPMESLSVLICGCCPGGNLSNIFALALEGDMNLSILMTACSTALALGMMPLLLYVYSQGFSQFVPFTNITIALIMILVPCGIGILINYKVPQYSKTITKVGLALLLISCVVIGVLAGISNGGKMFTALSPQIIAIAALMPLTGFICGYILSTLFSMNAPCRRTVSMEVGCQNIQLCTTILKLAFSPELIGQLYFFPVIYIVFQIVEALILIVLFRCHQRLRPSQIEPPEYAAVERAAEENNGPSKRDI
ncbi:sodium/bile acid cotransporter [Puntigrus tetrazona]|uniref:sodium/bile acid cotransporter n=1 Tax=Puntigrus tetrazona TaxID=1606681 RepID=UPI001C8A983F|nr:sodium/bile acid cotransporter [Puntigrus tetrazona]XP_043075341.1 sodium/bile acid cotransporter [Puntigrus tetrazona]XP_043075342.1 sodium/bile acid cotransporter [Puntigrus tetrazona]XP_043075343.1 sodium/bile acid cotransporter [Puntigrus tetrazona]XP_043075344.1 sodium/bile acid cotransporter [Puntigrus tetrazona]